MQQFQSLRRLLLFYILTLLIMLILYYTMMYSTLNTQSQRHSQFVFQALKHEVTEHEVSIDSDIEKILIKPFFQDISYQLIFILPSGETYVHRYTQSDEPQFDNITLSTIAALPSRDDGSYQINRHLLTGSIKLNSGHQIYVMLRHQPLDINWISYRFWLPLMSAIILFGMALLYMLKRRTNWEQLLQYTESLTTSAKEDYTPSPFINDKTNPEFLRLGHSLSRVSYQLHSNHRRIKTLRQRLEHLVNQAPLPMLMITRQGQIGFFNQRFEQVFTTTFQRDTHYRLTDFVTGSDKATQLLLQKLSTLKITRTLLVYKLEDKQAYQLHITPWFGAHDQIHGFTVFLNSVDKLVNQAGELALENQQLQLQIREATKLRFVIGHELRTPLNAIIGTLDLIEAHRLTPKQQEVLAVLTQSSQSMLTMLNNLLDMAKITAGKTELVSESTDIFKLGQHSSDLMVGSARRQGLNLLYFFTPECPRYISTESSRLRQIVLNLLDNAIKFTPSGCVTLIVEALTYEQMQDINTLSDKHNYSNNNLALANTARLKSLTANSLSASTTHQWIRFSIKDTGIGIADTDQRKLFSYFNQANPQISQAFGGTGLGLAISNSFAQLLGGFIQLESKLGVGSTFALYLPCHAPIYQPIYHFHSSLTYVRLIVVIEDEVCAHFMNIICSHLSIPISIVTIEQVCQQPNDYLRQDLQNLTPVMLVDYEYYSAYESELSASNTSTLSTQNSVVTSAASFNKSYDIMNRALDRLLDNIPTTKILISMKPERNIPSVLLDEFDSFLNKPLDIALLLSELMRLTKPHIDSQNLVVKKHRDSGVTAGEDEKSIENGDAESRPKKLSTNPLILVVDDNITNQKITCKLLDKLGYSSIVADDGKQALEQLKLHGQEVALILMDCRMPVMDGLQATQAIRAQGDDTPIVALTAHSAEDDRKACLDVGMDEFLEKPINKVKLQAMLQRFINIE